MKKTIFALLIIALFGLPKDADAQIKPKFGHVNSSAVLPLMPEYDSIQKTYQAYYLNLEKEGDMMSAEYESKLQEYMKNKEQYTPLLQQLKEKEIMDLQQRIQAFEASVTDDLQGKKELLMKPLLERFRKAVEDVAKDGKFNYVFDNRLEMLLYADQSDDITTLVKQKLGITK
jgi:outer membrane protein